MIVEQLSWYGGILEMELVEKMICFGTDGVDPEMVSSSN
jgi:hypothetical protein